MNQKECPIAISRMGSRSYCSGDSCMAWVPCRNPALKSVHPNDCLDYCESKTARNDGKTHLATFYDCQPWCKMIERGDR